MPELSLEPLKVALSPPSGEKIDIIAEKVLFFGQNFQLQGAIEKNLPLDPLYELVQVVE